MISSPHINKVLRKYVSPILRENGFTKVEARKARGWHGHCVWVFNIRAVGGYFSDVTGWSSMSVCMWLGVLYDFIPFHDDVKVDKNIRLIPEEYLCHMRSQLFTTLDQRAYTRHFENPAERNRRDIWWIEPDGTNTEEVAENIALCFMDVGKRWFVEHTDLERTFREIETERDCYDKFHRAEHLAKHLGKTQEHKIYAELAARERQRFNWM